MFHRKSPKMDVRGKNFLVPFKVTENFSSYMGGALLERGRLFLVHRREPVGEGTKGVFFLVHKRDLGGYGVLSAQGYEKE